VSLAVGEKGGLLHNRGIQGEELKIRSSLGEDE
jgi:hypothetical protein